MIRIPLGRDNLFLILDDEDSDLAALSWYAHRGKDKNFYAAHREGSGARERVWAHDLVMERINGHVPLEDGFLVDHINRDKLDCRRDNLRIANRSENAANKSKAKNSKATSKYKGVSKFRNKWKASITVNRKSIYLGTFDNETDAAYAYDAAAKEYFGEFAVLNME